VITEYLEKKDYQYQFEYIYKAYMDMTLATQNCNELLVYQQDKSSHKGYITS